MNEKQMRLVTKVGIGLGILLVFVIALSWYNDQGLLISYAGSRPDIPIAITVDNSLSLEDQEADLLVKIQDAANEYGCPENGGSNNALGTVEDDFEQGDEFVLKVANVGCKDGTDSRLYLAVYGVPLVKIVNYIGSGSDNPIVIRVDESLTSESAKNYLRAKMQVAINKDGCPENGGSDSFLGDIDTLDVEDDFVIELAYIKCKDGTNNGLFFKVITTRPHDVDLWNTSGSEIIETYAKYIKETDARLENYDIRCSDEPAVGELNFTSLKPKRQLHQLHSDCLLSRCHGVCVIPDWLYYTNAAGEVIVIQTYKGFEGTGYEEAELLEDNFGEIFGVLETEQQLDEYVTLSPKLRRLSLLDEVFEVSYVSVDDCEFDQEAPEVTKLISKNEEGFVYEGFFVDPTYTITLSYFRYSITFDGKITESKELLAECGKGVNL